MQRKSVYIIYNNKCSLYYFQFLRPLSFVSVECSHLATPTKLNWAASAYQGSSHPGEFDIVGGATLAVHMFCVKENSCLWNLKKTGKYLVLLMLLFCFSFLLLKQRTKRMFGRICKLIHVNMTHRAGQDWHCKQPKNGLDSKILSFYVALFLFFGSYLVSFICISKRQNTVPCHVK